MIIDRIEVIPLCVPFNGRPSGMPAPANPSEALHLVWCRVTTRSGLQGYGECLCYRAPMQAALVATLRDAIAPVYVGRSVDEREAVNLEVRRRFASFGRAGIVLNALAAVDIALWDIAGKATGQPIAALLGGAHRVEVPVMASLDKYNDGTSVCCRIEQALAANVAAIKVHESDLAVIEQGCEVISHERPYVADLNNALTFAELKAEVDRWRALELLWLEDPVWPPEALLERDVTGISIGLGADLGSAEQLALYARASSVNVIQPDVCMIGGLSESLKVLRRLAVHDTVLAPHTPFVGPAALASLHILAAMDKPSYFATIEADDHMDPFGTRLVRWQAAVKVPIGPGLGIDPDQQFLHRFSM